MEWDCTSGNPILLMYMGAAAPFLYAMRLDVLVLAASGGAPNPSFIEKPPKNHPFFTYKWAFCLCI